MSLWRVCPGLPGLLASWAGANVECWLLGHLSANSKWSHVLPVQAPKPRMCRCRNFVDCQLASVVVLYCMVDWVTTQRKRNVYVDWLNFPWTAPSTKQGLCAQSPLGFGCLSYYGQNMEKCVTEWQSMSPNYFSSHYVWRKWFCSKRRLGVGIL